MTFLWVAMISLSAADAPSAVVESLGQPCRARQVLAGCVVTHRDTGKELFVVTTSNEATAMELIFIDYAGGTAEVIEAPAGQGSWALNEVPGDRLAVGTYYDGQFMVFDLKAMKFVKNVGFPGEQYIWNLAPGKDGRIYGGTYPGGKLGAFNLDTYSVEDCGAPVPPNLYLRNVSALPDGRILCNFGMEKPDNLLYDPAAKTFSALPPSLEGASVGVTWNGYFVVGGKVLKGDTLEAVTPPFPVPPAEKGGWAVDTYVTTPETLLLRQGNACYRYRVGDAALTLIADLDLRGGRILGMNKAGELLGVRGQDYFRIKPGDTTLELKRIPGEASARPTLFLKIDASGHLWGGPHFGQTLFSLDTGSGAVNNTGAICDGGGEVYDVAFLGGKVYAAAYAGGDIVEYDPAQPWDQWNKKNPRPVTQLSKDGFIRPTGGLMAGPGGKLYSGWMAKYGTYGGALAITEPATGETEVIRNPLGEQAIDGLAVDEQCAYLGTSLSGNGLPEKKGESPRFGVVDLANKTVRFQQDFEKKTVVHRLFFDKKTACVAFTAGYTVHCYDTVKQALKPPFDPLPPAVSSNQLAGLGDGFVYYANMKQIFRLDLASGAAVLLAELPAPVKNITLNESGILYVSCEAEVYRVRVAP